MTTEDRCEGTAEESFDQAQAFTERNSSFEHGILHSKSMSKNVEVDMEDVSIQFFCAFFISFEYHEL